jgi:hypothetical protein
MAEQKYSFTQKAGACIAAFVVLFFVTSAQADGAARDRFNESVESIDDLAIHTEELTDLPMISVQGDGAIPGAIIEFFINGEATEALTNGIAQQVLVDDGGAFLGTLILPGVDAAYTISAQQTISYKELSATSNPVEQQNVVLDTEAPIGTISVWPTLPMYSNKTSLTVNYSTKTADSDALLNITRNGSVIADQLGSEGTIEIPLVTGDNNLKFFLTDLAGNESVALDEKTVSVDATVPLIRNTGTYFCGNASDTQELVCLTVGQFTGPLYGTAYAPVTGIIKGELSNVIFNGTSVVAKADGTVNQRIAVYVSPGDNTYDIEAEDLYGNIGYGTASVSWGNQSDSSYDSSDDEDVGSPTALCNDGTYSYSQNRSGTCSWHDGVDEWY